MVSQEPTDRQSAPPPRRAPLLLVDAMLGTLARWLRLAGYDAEYWRDGSDEALIAAARAAERLIVTKDHELAGRRGVCALLIATDDLEGQMAEVRRALGGDPAPFTRCAACNGLLQPLAHADAQERVPPYVWHTQHVFRACERCGRIYWKGTHWPAMQQRLNDEEGEEPA